MIDSIYRRIIVAAVAATLLYLIYLVLRPLFVPLAWAVILAIIGWPIFESLRRIVPRPEYAAPLLCSLLLLGAITIVAVPVGVRFGGELGEVLERMERGELDVGSKIREIPAVGDYLAGMADSSGLAGEDLSETMAEHRREVVHVATSIVRGVSTTLIALAICIFSTFFMFRYGERILADLHKMVVSLGGSGTDRLFAHVGTTLRGTFYGVFLTAMVQGLLAGVGYLLVGVGTPVLFGFLTVVAASVPFGPALVYLPVSIGIAVSESLWRGLFLASYGILVVSTADNIVRPLVISYTTRLSVFFVAIGAIGGIVSFGPIGIFAGPLILALAQSVWKEAVERAEVEALLEE